MIGNLVAIGYILLGILMSRIWWNFNRTESEFLSAEDGPFACFVCLFWPVWVMWHICRVVVVGILKLGDLLTKLIRGH